MQGFDIFDNVNFKFASLVKAIEETEYIPSFLESAGVFERDPVRTEMVWVEKRRNVISLLQTAQRGGVVDKSKADKIKKLSFSTLRIPYSSTMTATELADLVKFGSTTQIKTLMSELLLRIQKGQKSANLTLENMRLGACIGEVKDADGSLLYDWFAEFGETKPGEIAFDLSNIGEGDLHVKCNELTRSIIRATRGNYNANSRILALCGDNFFDNLTQLTEIKHVYQNRNNNAKVIPGGEAFGTFEYGGITWVNYRGTDDGTTVGIPTDEVKFVPTNTGLMLEVFAPGEKFEHLGQLGRKFYPEIVRDIPRDKFVEIELDSYPLHIAAAPLILRSGKRGA